MKKKVEQIVENSKMIEAIADHLLNDHIELMSENKTLKTVLNEFLENAGYVPNCGWTLEKCKAEHEAGNGLALLIEKAHRLLGY